MLLAIQKLPASHDSSPQFGESIASSISRIRPLATLRAFTPPKWPDNLRSLAFVSFGSLVYQFLHEGLHNVRRDTTNRVQTEALAAMTIATEIMGRNLPHAFDSCADIEAKARWIDEVSKLTESIEAGVICLLGAAPRENAIRKRNCHQCCSSVGIDEKSVAPKLSIDCFPVRLYSQASNIT